ncbi:MAG: YceI family protein, partial [Acidocella sp.]|nr:YceI family protein [Acidocella sp.]
MKTSCKTILGVAILCAAPLLGAVPAHAQTMPSTNPALVHPGAYNIEPTHTRVLFAVSHMGFTTWYGEFTHVSGSLTLNPKALAETTLAITIPANTISTSNTTLDGELNSPEWFDTAKYP